MSTIRDVAKHAGVSIATVSRILNNDEYFGVTKETKQKVLEAVKELNYKKKYRIHNIKENLWIFMKKQNL